jgi:hypothetical protein
MGITPQFLFNGCYISEIIFVLYHTLNILSTKTFRGDRNPNPISKIQSSCRVRSFRYRAFQLVKLRASLEKWVIAKDLL